jgi:spore maturation protein CgeB
MKVFCVFGKYQYGDAGRGIGTEYAAFVPALKKLGHEVVHFESWDRSLYRNFEELNSALLGAVEKEQPQVLLTVQMHYEIWSETLRIIKNRGDVATVCWTTDDSWKYREFSRFVGHEYDAMTTTYANMIQKYHRDGIPNVLLTQWAANSEFLREPLAARECVYPVSFIGMAHGGRKKQISFLRASGVDVACFGHGWPVGSIEFDRIADIINKSVISLNFSNSRGENQIKARTFEVPGAGGFLMTQPARDLDKYYINGKEIVTFDNEKDLLEKIRYFLGNHNERNRIAIAGYERTIREHTYDLRLKEILEFTVHAKKCIGTCPSARSDTFKNIASRHDKTLFLRLLRPLLIWPCRVIWGRERGPRAARRIIYEFSWRVLGNKTYSASGWPGRIFYRES